MAITRYAGDRIVVDTSDTKPTGVLPGAFLVDSGNRTPWIKTGYTGTTADPTDAWVQLVGGGGGGSPGGSNTQVQFNSNGSFGGNSNLTFTSSNQLNVNKLKIAGNLIDSNSYIGEGGMVLTNEGQTGVNWKSIESVLSGVGGSGVANYVARWSDEDTLTSGTIYDNGNVGIGTIAPAAKLDVTHDGAWARLGYDSYATFQFYRNLPASSTSLPVMIVRQTHPDDDQTALIVDQDGSGNILELIEDSTTRVVVKADGKVGIGTTSPGCELHVSGEDPRIRVDGITDSHPGFELSENGTRKWITYNNYVNDNLTFKTNADIRMVIQQDGNVGIGTGGPADLLELYSAGGGIRIEATAASPNAIAQLAYSNTNGFFFRLPDDENNENVMIRSYGTSHFKGGSVGIGTDTPLGVLHLNGANTQVYYEESDGATNTKLWKLGAQGGTFVGRAMLDADSGGSVWLQVDRTTNTIDSVSFPAGNLGVNTLLPEHKLHVAGDAIISGVLYDSTNSSGVSGHVLTSEVGGPQWKMIEDVLSGVGGNGTAEYIPRWIDSDTIGDSVIAQSGSAIGIGTDAPGKTLDVDGDIRIRGDSGTLSFYRDTSPSDIAYIKYLNGTSRLDIVANNKAIVFMNENGPAESMRITSAGSVGIGTDAPNELLEIFNSTADGNATIRLSAEGDTSGERALEFFEGAYNRFRIATVGANGNLEIHRSTTGNSWEAIPAISINKADGNVGIGTNTPAQKLHSYASAGGRAALFDGAANWFTTKIQGSTTSHQSYGQMILAGTSSSDKALRIYNAAGTSDLFIVLGDGNVGIGTDAPGGRLDVDAGYMVNEQGRQDQVSNTLPQPYYWFDGTNDYIALTSQALAGTFTISMWINPDDVTGANLLGLSSSNANYLWINSSGEVDLKSSDLNIEFTDSNIIAGVWQHICITRDGSNIPKFYKNGVLVQTLGADAGTFTFDQIGRYYNGSNTNFFGGSISGTRIHNVALSDTEIKELYSGASVAFKYKGANQTHLVTAGSCTEQGSGTINSSSATAFNFSSGALYDRIGFTLSSTLTAGKKYRISWTALTSSSGYIQVRSATTSAFLDAGGTNFGSISGGAGSFEWVALGDEAYITFKNLSTPTTVVLSGFEVVQIGAVADYDGSGMTGGTWYDKSGNNLDATVTGASLENRATALIVDDRIGIGTNSPSVGLQVGNSVLNETKLVVFNSEGGVPAGLQVKARTNRAKIHVADNDSNAYVIAEGLRAFFGATASGASTNIAVQSDGNVGIGTTDPGYLFDVSDDSSNIAIFRSSVTNYARVIIRAGAAGDAQLSFQNNTSTKWTIGNDGGDSDKFKIEAGSGAFGTSPLVCILSGGNFGIGIDSPAYLLHLSAAAADIKVTSTTGTNRAGIQATNSGGTSYFYKESSGGGGAVPGTLPYATVVGGGGHTQFATNNTVKATILTDGNLGIGDNLVAPEHRLHVSGDAIISGVLYDSTNSSGVSGHVLTSEVGGPQWKMIEDVLSGVGGNGTANYIPIWEDEDTIGNSIIYQDGNDANIGIGNALPSGTLDIVGSNGTVDVAADGDAQELVIRNNDRAGIQILSSETDMSSVVFGSAADANGANIFYGPTSKLLTIGSQVAAGQVAFRAANGVEAVRIDAAGEVGIGTNAPASVLHLNHSSEHTRLRMQTIATKAALIDFYSASTVRWSWGVDNNQGYAKFENRTTANDAIRLVDSDDGVLLAPEAGNVGVGTTTPKTLLEASGVIRSTHATSVTAGVGIEMLYNNTDGTGYLYSYDRDGSAYKTTRIGSESYFIADGNVGIATATPEHQFQVYGDALISGKFYDSTNSTGDKGYVLTSDDSGPLWKASGDFDGLSGNLIATGQTLQTQITSNDTDIAANTANLITTGQTLQTQITANDGDISTLTSNLITTGQTLQTQITANDGDISTLTSNLITTGQTLQTQITSNDTDIATNATNIATNVTNIATNVTNIATNATNIATNVTNISTNASNLITTGQYLTDEINTVSGLIPATVIDGGGTANKVPLWSDANTIGDSVIAQSGSAIGIGTTAPTQFLDILATQESDAGIRVTLNCNLDSQAPQLVLNRAAQNGGIVDSGDVLGAIKFGGYDGNSVENNTKIEAIVNGTPSNDNMPTDLRFYTASAGSPVHAMTINKDQQVGIGTHAPHQYAKLHTLTNGTDNQLRIEAHRNDVGQTSVRGYYSRGSAASPVIVQDNDTIFEAQGWGYDGANHWRVAEIDFQVDGTPGTNDMPGRLVFSTTADGATAPTEHMRIQSDGNVGIGTNSAGEVLQVKGNMTLRGATNLRYKIANDSNNNWAEIGNDGASGENTLEFFTGSSSVPSMSITNGKLVGIGTATPSTILEVATSANSSDGTFSSWSTSAAHSGTIIFKKSASNTIGTYLETADGERLGTIAVYGSTSSNTLSQTTASIYFQQDGAATGSRVPSRITFLTSPSANNMAEVMRINSVGNVGIGTTAPIAKLQVSGRIGAGELGNSQITRNGLNLYVDFSDKACVSGTSSSEVPLDLGPNNYSMTLFNQTFFEYKDGIGTYRFDGSSDAIKIANFVVAGNANSYEFWFYANAQSSWETLWDSGTERPLLGTNGSNLRAYPDATNHATISTGRWYHVVWAFASNSDYDVFVNGARVTEADNYGATQRTGTFEAWIGEAIGSEAFNGWVSIVRAYSRQLTPADVMQNYNAEVGTFAVVTPELGIVQSGGSVGIGITNPNSPLVVISPDNTDHNAIIGAYTNNLSVGVELHHYGLRGATTTADGSTALDTNQKLMLDAKGTGDVLIQTYGGTGKVGIGTDNPAYLLDVDDGSSNIAIFRSSVTNYARVIIRSGASGDAQLSFQNNTSTKWSIGNDGGDSDKFKIATGGGAFVASEAVIIDTSGNLSILGTLTEASSIAIKENVETYSPSLENISKIRPVRFNKKKSKKKEVGLVAEELAEMFPELVETDKDGKPSGVNYSRAVAVLLHGFKELYKEVKELKEKI